jgi:hypothetical protein
MFGKKKERKKKLEKEKTAVTAAIAEDLDIYSRYADIVAPFDSMGTPGGRITGAYLENLYPNTSEYTAARRLAREFGLSATLQAEVDANTPITDSIRELYPDIHPRVVPMVEVLHQHGVRQNRSKMSGYSGIKPGEPLTLDYLKNEIVDKGAKDPDGAVWGSVEALLQFLLRVNKLDIPEGGQKIIDTLNSLGYKQSANPDDITQGSKHTEHEVAQQRLQDLREWSSAAAAAASVRETPIPGGHNLMTQGIASMASAEARRRNVDATGARFTEAEEKLKHVLQHDERAAVDVGARMQLLEKKALESRQLAEQKAEIAEAGRLAAETHKSAAAAASSAAVQAKETAALVGRHRRRLAEAATHEDSEGEDSEDEDEAI